MSEKYSGVRALWDNNTQTFRLRNGKTIQPPKVFAELLSPTIESVTQLDGVLWFGYGQQDDWSQKLADNVQDDDLWLRLQYLVFDIPNSSATTEERFSIINTLSFREGIHNYIAILTLRFSFESHSTNYV